MKFAVSIVNPPNYGSSEAFREIGETLHYGLLALGYDSVLTFETNLPDRQHIILGSNLLPYFQIDLSPTAILYNLEQISPESPWIQTTLLNFFRQHRVWDYSLRNIEQFAQFGIHHVQHLPIGYVPQLTRIPPAHEDIDVLFYGAPNDRRLHIIHTLQAKGLNVVAFCGVFGQERDALIARARIVLNVHFYEAKVFEIARISYLLANRKFVISERGTGSAEENAFSNGVLFVEYEKLVETCVAFLDRSEERTRIAAIGFQQMQQRSEPHFLRSLLD